jgi:hypothetical protein
MNYAEAVDRTKTRLRAIFPERDLRYEELWVYASRADDGHDMIVVGGEVSHRKDLSRFLFEFERSTGSEVRAWLNAALDGHDGVGTHRRANGHRSGAFRSRESRE